MVESTRVSHIWEQIKMLTPDELLALRLKMQGLDEEEGGAGVREPRNPKEPLPSLASELDWTDRREYMD